MDQQHFLDNYIGKFNQQDHSGFEEFFAPNIKMFNGSLIFDGIEAIKEHYSKIWSVMKETLNVKEFLPINNERLVIELHTHFDVPESKADTPFGVIQQGQQFDFHGLILYKIDKNNLFYEVHVSYLSFIRTDTDGTQTNIGMPH